MAIRSLLLLLLTKTYTYKPLRPTYFVRESDLHDSPKETWQKTFNTDRDIPAAVGFPSSVGELPSVAASAIIEATGNNHDAALSKVK